MKRYSEDPVSKIPEKRSSRQIKSENSQIQNDILYDVLYFLEREEIEKKRLVSKQWNFNILAHDNILPLLIFKKLNYSQAFGYKCWSILPKTKPTNRTNPINCNSALLILEHIPDIWLTKIICKEVVFNCQVCINNIVIANEVYLAGNNGSDLDVGMRKNDILSFRKIMRNKGVKIKVIKASFILHGAQTKTNVDREIEKISKLLNDHINTSQLHMEFAYSTASSYISNFTTASFNKPYESITLDFTCAYFDENLPIDHFLFIGNRGAKYYLLFDFNQFEMVVGKIIISNFMNYPNPEEMIHKVSFNYKNPHFFKLFLMKELDKYIKKIILQNEIGRFPIKNFKDCEYNEDAEFKHFKIQRKDGWILNVDIPNFEKNINNSLCFHVLEFTIEKC